MRGVQNDVIARYFTRKRDQFDLVPSIRSMVEFRYLNLDFDNYPSPALGVWGMDLILCRNVLIYFDIETVASVAEKLLASLSTHGWLFLGASDPMLSELVDCEVIMTSSGLAYRRPRADAVPRQRPQRLDPSAQTVKLPPVSPVPWSTIWPDGPPEIPAHLQAPLPPIQPRTTGAVPPSFEPVLSNVPPNVSIGTPASFGTTLPPIPRVASTSLGDASTTAPSDAALDRSPDSAVTVALLQALYEARNYVMVVQHADTVIKHTPDQDTPWIVYVRALANLGRLPEAEQVCTAALDRHSMSAELWYLQAILLAEANRPAESAQAAWRAIYLDRTLAVAHLALGTALRKTGDMTGARLAFTNTLRALDALPPNAVVPASDGETRERIAMAARVHLQLAEEVA
jgi:chemotaxis protein methyltransferase CheR